jgi:hypothetical protein
MTSSTAAITTEPTRKTGRMASLWRALIAIDEAIHLDPVERLEKRVRSLEEQMAAHSESREAAITKSHWPA